MWRSLREVVSSEADRIGDLYSRMMSVCLPAAGILPCDIVWGGGGYADTNSVKFYLILCFVFDAVLQKTRVSLFLKVEVVWVYVNVCGFGSTTVCVCVCVMWTSDRQRVWLEGVVFCAVWVWLFCAL